MNNPYSNPSGRTSIPWQFSSAWFVQLALQQIKEMETASNSNKWGSNQMLGKWKTCSGCGNEWTHQLSTVCGRCGDVLGQALPEESEPLITADEIALLEAPVEELRQSDPQSIIELHNLLVEAFRSSCSHLANQSVPPIEVRKGLLVSKEWDAHYQNLSSIQPQSLLWISLKHSMLGNPFEGEITEWTNANGGAERSNPNLGKFVAASAVGLLAAILWG